MPVRNMPRAVDELNNGKIPASERQHAKGAGGRAANPVVGSEDAAFSPLTPPKPAKGGKAAKGAVIVLEPNIIQIDVRIKGTTPLLVHNWDKKALIQMLGGHFGAPKLPKSERQPEQEAESSRYVYMHGKTEYDGMPAGAFKSAIVGAGRFVDGIPMTMAKRMVFIHADGTSKPLEFRIGSRDLRFSGKPVVRIYGDWEMDTSMIRVDNGSPDVRFRARYDEWSAVLRVEFNSNILSTSQVVSLINLAGIHEGVGEMRPSAPVNATGEYGRWTVDG